MLSIGAFSRLAGVSAKVLRKYDALDLFRPVWVDRDTSYRYYSPAQLPQLRRILALRDLGLGLTEVRALIVDGADLQSTLDRRRRELERERREADRRLAALDIQLEAGGRSDVVVRPIAAVRVATLALGPTDDDAEAFYELEAYVRDLHRRAQGPPGSIVDADGADLIFVPTRGAVAAKGRIRPDRLPACRAATIIQRGPYEALAGAQATLLDWVASTGLSADGPLRILYLQFGAEPELRVPRGYVVDRAADFVTELQLPVA